MGASRLGLVLAWALAACGDNIDPYELQLAADPGCAWGSDAVAATITVIDTGPTEIDGNAVVCTLEVHAIDSRGSDRVSWSGICSAFALPIADHTLAHDQQASWDLAIWDLVDNPLPPDNYTFWIRSIEEQDAQHLGWVYATSNSFRIALPECTPAD